MKEFNTYLNFDGNAREAMTFYAKCLNAQLDVMTFADAKTGTPADAERVMHARIDTGSAILMASDCPPGMPLKQGNNFSISISCESNAEVDRLLAALGEGGKVTMAAQDMFWGAYFGMITDRFGVAWMFNFEHATK